jgi:low affinity Fe/Cu permease
MKLARLFHWSQTALLAPACSVQAICALELFIVQN